MANCNTAYDPGRRPIAAAWMVYFVIAADQVALPSAASLVTADLGVSVSVLQIALALFSVVAASLYLVTGRLGDLVGHRAVFRYATIFLFAGEMLAALATNAVMLLVGWALLRGIGFALALPNVLAMLTGYPAQRRNTVFAAYATGGPTGALLGPLAMGWIATAFSWRIFFGAELVLLLAAFLLAGRIPSRRRAGGASMDIAGAALAIAGSSAIILAATLAGTYGWLRLARPVVMGQRVLYAGEWSPAIMVAVAGLVVTSLLVLHLRRRERRGALPLFRVSLFANRGFVVGWLVIACVFFVLSSVMFTVPVFVQTAHGLDPVRTSWVISSFALAMVLGGAFSGVFVRWMAVRTVLVTGALVIAAGLGVASGLVDSVVPFAAVLALAGLGTGLVFAQAPNAAMSAVAEGERGDAGGLNAVGEESGVGLGVAVSGSVLIGLGITVGAMRATGLLLVGVALLMVVGTILLPRERPE